MPKVHFEIVDKNAVIPTKGTPFSVGYDLTVIKVFKKISEKTTLYDTGIKVQPEKGFYTEIIPRSSIIKTGYILSNSIGVIDSDYTGTLLICLTKVDDSFPDLELPFTKCQLVLRPYLDYELVQKTLEETERGDKGFGSTDNKYAYFSKLEKYIFENKLDVIWDYEYNKNNKWIAKCFLDKELIATGKDSTKEKAQDNASWHVLVKLDIIPPFIKK